MEAAFATGMELVNVSRPRHIDLMRPDLIVDLRLNVNCLLHHWDLVIKQTPKQHLSSLVLVSSNHCVLRGAVYDQGSSLLAPDTTGPRFDIAARATRSNGTERGVVNTMTFSCL